MLDPDILCSRCEPISGRAHDYEIVDAEQTSASIQRWIAFLCTGIRPSIGTKNLIPEEVNYSKIAIRVTVMNKVQLLLASEPREPLKSRSLYVIFFVEKDVRVKRRRTRDYHHHKKT
jgi:hypothetical protein